MSSQTVVLPDSIVDDHRLRRGAHLQVAGALAVLGHPATIAEVAERCRLRIDTARYSLSTLVEIGLAELIPPEGRASRYAPHRYALTVEVARLQRGASAKRASSSSKAKPQAA